MLEISYRQEGDYLMPNLEMPPQTEGRIGKYGRLREQYLKDHRRGLYGLLQTQCQLRSHLLETDREANEMKEVLLAQLLEKNPMPQTEDTLERTRHQNSLEAQAEEIILAEVIYNN